MGTEQQIIIDDRSRANRWPQWRLFVALATGLAVVGIALGSAVMGHADAMPMAAVAVLGAITSVWLARLLLAQRAVSDERLQLEQSRALVELSRALADTTKLNETLDLVTTWAARLLNARAAAIELVTREGNQLELRAVHGLAVPDSARYSPLHDGLSARLAQKGAATEAGQELRSASLFSQPDGPAAQVGSAVAAAPLHYRDRVLGVITCVGRRQFSPADLALLGALADHAAVAIENARLFEQVHMLSLTDPLTGLANRRQLERDLAREFAAAARGRRLILVMFDLNNFKAYNDTYGHPAGDGALRAFAHALHSETRAMNTAARFGGDEFLVLLTDSSRGGAETFIERIRLRFPGSHAIPPQDQLSVTAGYAEYEPWMTTADDLIAAADRNLYRAKYFRGLTRVHSGPDAD